MMVPAGVVCPRGNCTTTPVFAGLVFSCAGVYWGCMSDPSYLDDPSFSEEHDGPLISPDRPSDGRDPSPRQIAAMVEAIRRAYPRRPVGQSAEPWTPPVAMAPEGSDPELVGKAV